MHTLGGDLCEPARPERGKALVRDAGGRHSRQEYIELAALPTTPYWARVLATDVLTGWGLPRLHETTELVVSELVTNAIKVSGVGVHPPSYPGRRRVRCIGMRLHGDAHSVIVAVWDHDPRFPQATTPGPDDEAGRGLLLVSSLAQRWGYYRPRTNTGANGRRLWPGLHGKVVWAEISDRPEAADEHPPIPPTAA